MKRLIAAAAAAVAIAGVAAVGLAAFPAGAQVCYPPGSPACGPTTTAATTATTIGAEVQGTVEDRAAVSVDVLVSGLQTTNPALAEKITAAVAQLDAVDLSDPAAAAPVLAAFFEAMKEALPDFKLATITTMTVQNPDGTFSTAAVTVTRDPATGEVGLVSVGGGYRPGSRIQIFVESTPILLGEVTASQAGKFMSAVKLPAGLDAGSHTLVARGLDPAGKPLVTGQPITVKEAPGKDELAAGDQLAAPPADDNNGMSGTAALGLLVVALAVVSVVLFLARKRPTHSTPAGAPDAE